MKNIITKLGIIMMILIRSILLAAPVSAELINNVQTIPVRFLSDVSTKDIEPGNAIPLQIVQDIYNGEQKLFAQGGAGYAYIDNLEAARSLGRGAKLSISRGVLVDINGKSHEVQLSANAKGDGRLMPVAGGLMAGVSSLELASNVGSATGIIFAVGAILSTIAVFRTKGREATLSSGKVMFATLTGTLAS